MSTGASEWSEGPLDSVAELIRGVSYKKAEASDQPAPGVYPILRATNIQDGRLVFDELVYVPRERIRDEQWLRVGDIVVATSSGSLTVVGKAAGVRREWRGSFGAFCAVLRPRPEQARWLHWFLQSPAYLNHVREKAAGVNINNLRRSHLEKLPVPIAPPPTRGAIVAKIEQLFSDLDAGEAALERAQRNLERYRASLLKAAVEGNLTEEWRKENPPEETGEELLQRILAERRKRWEEDYLAKYEARGKKPPKNWRSKYKEPEGPDTEGLPALPEGWCWAAVDTVGEVQLGRQRSPKYHDGEHMRPYLRVANVFEDRVDASDVMEMDFPPQDFERYALRTGDVLLNEGQSAELVGRPAIYRDEVPGACFTNTLVRFRAGASVETEFALIVFLAYLRDGTFRRIARITTNIAHLGAGRFAALHFPVPPMWEQKEIVEAVRGATDAVRREVDPILKRCVAEGRRLRRSILAGAFSGGLSPDSRVGVGPQPGGVGQ